MKTLDQLVDDIFIKEGDVYAVVDQPTGRGGITLDTLTRYMRWKMGSPVTPTTEDLQALSHESARAVVEWTLEQLMGEMKIGLLFEPLKLLLLDFGYNSGGPRAIRWLQRVLFINPTGVMDTQTLNALGKVDARIVHQALIAGRMQMVHAWADAPDNHKFEDGLLTRVLSFTLVKV